ncbi:THAP domain-containing protein 9 [Dufourea novaeangliae]|uniref:THAP domain-containing protein 9 n=1 Tax=Dufourea novaeangliae TaxID=178035 RepID=A0A154P8B4_DUFNO|nr:THAP domain-containing protein 9 [Dufourea novaeangliae]
MIVHLKGQWKWPIGYFLINKINSTVQAQLMVNALNLLADSGVKVWSVTCDGTATNISTLQLLGCNLIAENFVNMKTFFNHPSRSYKIYAILDAAHMLKLSRNTFAEYSDLRIDNDSIQWKYIENLFNLQNELTLKFKNKLDSNCINWQQNKMKVRYAAHTLSSSVANALQFLCANGTKGFENSESTVTFIKNIDRIFDFLNSRSPIGKGFKKPLRLADIPSLKIAMEKRIEYLFRLRNSNGQFIYQSRKKTFIIGFACAIKSILSVAEELLIQTNYKYLLTYNFSQDYLEIFFSKIRSRHGFNNNPNAIQFCSAFKQILLKNRIHVSPAVNCVALNDDTIGSIFKIEWPKKNKTATADDDTEIEVGTIPTLHLQMKDYILHYIGGYVVKSLLKTLDCASCATVLVLQKNDHAYHHSTIYSKFTDLVNNGGLRGLPSVTR